MVIEFKKASRTRIPIKIELFGPPGAGKTWSSLLIAKSMDCKNVCLIDTEQSASLYDEHFDFQVAEIHPDDYKNQQKKFIKDFCATFEAAVVEMKADCIIVDSLTHLWDAVKEYVSSLGGRYTDWNKGTPLWRDIIKMILSCPVPVIICSRASYDDVIETKERNGKTTYDVKRIGTKADVRSTSDYEFTTVISIDMNHRFKATKDRTGLFASTMGEDGEPRELNEQVGKELRAWMNGGKLEVQEFQSVNVDESVKEPTKQTATEKLKQKKEIVKEKKPTKPESGNDTAGAWKKEANKFLDAIDNCDSHEDIIAIVESIETFVTDDKEIPQDAVKLLRDTASAKVMELEPSF